VRLGIEAPRHIPVVRAELKPLPSEDANLDAAETKTPTAVDRLRIRRGATRGIGSPPRAPSR
jgi:hypothetical protein